MLHRKLEQYTIKFYGDKNPVTITLYTDGEKKCSCSRSKTFFGCTHVRDFYRGDGHTLVAALRFEPKH
jgi:hypothetical protein